jgi:hypothetical protein
VNCIPLAQHRCVYWTDTFTFLWDIYLSMQLQAWDKDVRVILVRISHFEYIIYISQFVYASLAWCEITSLLISTGIKSLLISTSSSTCQYPEWPPAKHLLDRRDDRYMSCVIYVSTGTRFPPAQGKQSTGSPAAGQRPNLKYYHDSRLSTLSRTDPTMQLSVAQNGRKKVIALNGISNKLDCCAVSCGQARTSWVLSGLVHIMPKTCRLICHPCRPTIKRKVEFGAMEIVRFGYGTTGSTARYCWNALYSSSIRSRSRLAEYEVIDYWSNSLDGVANTENVMLILNIPWFYQCDLNFWILEKLGKALQYWSSPHRMPSNCGGAEIEQLII